MSLMAGCFNMVPVRNPDNVRYTHNPSYQGVPKKVIPVVVDKTFSYQDQL